MVVAPVVISYDTEPKLKISDRPSSFRPSAYSGDMYIAVPTTWPSSLKCRAVTIVASGDVFEADGHAGGRPKVVQAGKFWRIWRWK